MKKASFSDCIEGGKKMKNLRRKSLLLMLLCLLMLAFGTVQAEAAAVKVNGQGVTITSLSMREKAGVKGKLIQTIKKGRAVLVKKKLKNGWYQVFFNGKTGYVSGKYITPIETAQKQYGIPVRKTGANMRMRNAPSTNGKALGIIPDGSLLTVVGSSGNYHKITWSGKVGYVVKGYFTSNIKVRKLRTSIRFRSAPSTSAPVVSGLASIPAGATVYCFVLNNGWWHVKYKNRIGYLADGYFTNQNPGTQTASAGVAKQTTTSVRMRSTPNTSSDDTILTILPTGAKVTVLSQSGEWSKVKYGGMTGYVASAYLK